MYLKLINKNLLLDLPVLIVRECFIDRMNTNVKVGA
jgi:hypothetical protein